MEGICFLKHILEPHKWECIGHTFIKYINAESIPSHLRYSPHLLWQPEVTCIPAQEKGRIPQRWLGCLWQQTSQHDHPPPKPAQGLARSPGLTRAEKKELSWNTSTSDCILRQCKKPTLRKVSRLCGWRVCEKVQSSLRNNTKSRLLASAVDSSVSCENNSIRKFSSSCKNSTK